MKFPTTVSPLNQFLSSVGGKIVKISDSISVGDQWLSPADLTKIGMPKTSLRVDHPDTGKQGYRIGLEVFHQLHCINLLRRVTYRDYYEPLGGEFAAGPEALQMHTGKLLHLRSPHIQIVAEQNVTRSLSGSSPIEYAV